MVAYANLSDICICGYAIKNVVGAFQNVCVKFTYVLTSKCPSLKHSVLLQAHIQPKYRVSIRSSLITKIYYKKTTVHVI